MLLSAVIFVYMMTSEAEKQFETNKNLKATGLTAVITAGILAICFLLAWAPPKLTAPPTDLGVEVNLGTSDQGSGDIAPMAPGEPAQAEDANSTPPPPAQQVAETQPPVIPNNDDNAPPVNTSPKPEHKTPKHTVNTVKAPRPKPVTTPAPPKPQRPKAVFKGGKSTTEGGNNSDDFNKVRNQGIAGGNGDQGKPNGNPNSDSYNGNGGRGNSGVSISDGLGGRGIAGSFHFQDSYSHGGTVFVTVTVDESGRVTSADVKLSSGDPQIDRIAKRRAMEVKFTKGTSVQTGTLKMRFEEPKG